MKLQPEMARAVGKTARVRAASGDLLTGVTVLDAAARQVKATGLRRMLPYAPKFEEQRARYGLDRWYVVTFDEKLRPPRRAAYSPTWRVWRSPRLLFPWSSRRATERRAAWPLP